MSNSPVPRKQYTLTRSIERKSSPVHPINRTAYHVSNIALNKSHDVKLPKPELKGLLGLFEPGTCYLEVGRQLLSTSVVTMQVLTHGILTEVVQQIDSIGTAQRVKLDDDEL